MVFVALCLMLSASIGVNAQTVKSPEFTLIALPDPQMYSEYFPETFKQQTEWIAGHRDELNIKFVIGLGDNVNDGDSEAQWKNASDAMSVLDKASIPYAMAIGNHDYLHSKPPTRSAPMFNRFFGKSHYAGKSWYGGSTYPSGTSENFFVTLPIEEEKYLLLFLEYFPRREAIAWAKTVLAGHAGYRVIVVTHALEGSDAFRNGECDYNGPAAEGLETNTLDGEQMWDTLISQYPNIFLALNGHVNGAAHETDYGKHGNAVTQILSDYQDDAEGGGGFLRILTFKPTEHQIVVTTYSPSSQSYKKDEQNSFTVPYDNERLDLKLAGIRGRVRSRECDSIAANISLTKGAHREIAFADAEGYFATPSTLEPGVYRVNANAPGFATSTITVEARSGFVTPVRFYLAKADKEFTMTAPTLCEVFAGATATIPVVIKRIGGFAPPIRLSVSGLPDGIEAVVSPAILKANRSMSMKLTARSQVSPGKYRIMVTANAGGMERIAPIDLVVTRASTAADDTSWHLGGDKEVSEH
jgi:hypothetical protein